MTVPDGRGSTLLVLEHDPTDPLLRLQGWLAETGVSLDVRQLHAGAELPSRTDGYAGLISLGGEMGAGDDDIAPWLPETRKLLAAAVTDQTPTLGICLGAQLLATATGGTVTRGENGPEIGAHLAAKRDAAESDPLFGLLPMTPDIMHYHYDVVSRLPPGAVLLLSGTGYPNQAWRIGPAAWGVQFHIEAGAADLRDWADTEKRPHTGRLGAMLDVADTEMAQVWRAFAHRFVGLAAGRLVPGMRLPMANRSDS